MFNKFSGKYEPDKDVFREPSDESIAKFRQVQLKLDRISDGNEEELAALFIHRLPVLKHGGRHAQRIADLLHIREGQVARAALYLAQKADGQPRTFSQRLQRETLFLTDFPNGRAIFVHAGFLPSAPSGAFFNYTINQCA